MPIKGLIDSPLPISEITITGYKSLQEPHPISIKPLTIFSGANSSGKSSVFQPILLLKQTIEASYDAGVLKLDGPNIFFTDPKQFFSDALHTSISSMSIEIKIGIAQGYLLTYQLNKDVIEILENAHLFKEDGEIYIETSLRQNMTIKEIQEEMQTKPSLEAFRVAVEGISTSPVVWKVIRNRCFLNISLVSSTSDIEISNLNFGIFPIGQLAQEISEIIHIPGIRANPQRAYKIGSVLGTKFAGVFENYIASIIQHWYSKNDHRRYLLNQQLNSLGLTSTIVLQQIDNTQQEILVGRTLHSPQNDLVNIADVGSGVSQVLPILVALLVAKAGQIVYIEQPELHLHPRAQLALAQILADAANRDVRVVIETHSDLLLLAIQTLIAEGKFNPNKIILHWFARGDDGITHISSRELDTTGSYGDWPEDFGDVRLDAQSRYLDATDASEMES